MAKVSIVIATHNAGTYLTECLESIFSQTFHDFECIVVNDGSTDETAKVLGSFDDKRLKIINLQKNCGISIARNLAGKYASGEYIAVMDADDVAFPQRLELQVEFLEKNSNIHFLGSRTVRVYENISNIIDYPNHPLDDSTIKSRLILLNGSALIHPSTIMRASFLEKNWVYYPARKMDEDHALWIDALALGAQFACVKQPLLYKRRHGRNITLTEAGTKEPAKTPLRQKLLCLFTPDLTSNQAMALARIMQKGIQLRKEEISLALEAARIVKNSPRSPFGENRDMFNSIVEHYASQVKKFI